MLRKIMTGAVIALGLASAPAKAADELNFGFISTESSSNLKVMFEPWLAEMSKATGLKVNAFFATDYAGIIEGMRFGKVQVAWYGNKSAMEAVDRAGGEIFAQTIPDSGLPGYYAHIIVHKDSPFQKLDDILKCDKTLDFGIGDPNSTSGFLVPTTFIFAARDIDPKACFKTVRNANHEANSLAVANKLVSAAANNSENLDRLKITKPDDYAKIRVIWTSPLIPSDPLVWRKDLDDATKQKLSAFIFGYGKSGNAEEDAKANAILKGMTWTGFKPSDNNQLLPIRQMELTKELAKVQADDKLGADEKKAKIEELKTKIANIEKQLGATKS
ncbi:MULTISPECIES: phosphonate ABC transporter substrate-binding protein [Rhodomicrobium]|uniref:phosphonate ABC transporter substrate-binding protein n=1 Tax=Rhodomicrobium TaxID=1068 RepID=UPI000B4AFD4B|nr:MULTISPECIES: phosphonate ABC transporter substrate-binding protein [Rhodomicrobium]